MARKPVVIDAARKTFLEDLGKEVVSKLDGMFFEVEGTPVANVKYSDGTWKKKTLIAGWEFALAYAYVGARGQILFGLTPEDAQEYQFAEMNAKELDSYFPFVGTEVAKQFGLEGENLTQLLDQIVIKRVEDVENAEARAKQEAAVAYQNNETFGMF